MQGPRFQHKAQQVRRILLWTLVANWVVAGAKLLVGFLSGSMSLVADGFHSLLDGSSNIIGLISLKAAIKPADPRYPYGRRKYETFAAVGIQFTPLGCPTVGFAGWERVWWTRLVGRVVYGFSYDTPHGVGHRSVGRASAGLHGSFDGPVTK